MPAFPSRIATRHRPSLSSLVRRTLKRQIRRSTTTVALARFSWNAGVYMGVTTVEHWSRALVAAGKPAETPVAILRRVSFPDQQRIDTTLAAVAAVTKRRFAAAGGFIIGDVPRTGAAWSWFEKRPLFGQTILVTRPAQQADELARPWRNWAPTCLCSRRLNQAIAADGQRPTEC